MRQAMKRYSERKFLLNLVMIYAKRILAGARI
jgi:hypothetical protein